MPISEQLPMTLRRSPQHAQEIWSKAHDAAAKTYGDGERAHRTAFAALKHEYEKVGDHWEKKTHAGPSDEGATDRSGRTEGGVNARAPKAHLEDIARRLNIRGRSQMTKDELVDAIQKANARETREARSRGR